MKRFLIEIKARCDDHGRVRDLLLSRRADFKGTDRQIDTYFRVAHGRLKLRESRIENHLIFYERENQEGPKASNVMLFPNPAGSSLKDILVRSLGVLAVVDKSREIYFLDNVKFHLDTVEDLGTFMEIEAIGEDQAEREKLQRQCREYLGLFGVEEAALIAGSYSDLLLEGKRERSKL